MKKKTVLLLLIPVAVYAAGAYFLPMSAILKVSLADTGETGFRLSAHASVIRFTFRQAILSTLITLILGIPGAWVFSTYRIRGKRFFNAILSVPFMLPTVIVAAGFNALLGQNGWLNLLLMKVFSLKAAPIRLINTFPIIIIAHVFYNTSLVIRTVGNAWAMIDRRIPDAAKTLGCSGFSLYRKIIVPLLRPSLLSAALLVFLFDFTSYGIILLLGGPRFRTIEAEISYRTLQMLDLRTAGILSILQIILTVLIVFAEKKIGSRSYSTKKIKVYDEDLITPRRFGEKILVNVIVYGLLLFTLLPLAALVLRSFMVLKADIGRTKAATGLSLIYYRNLFVNSRSSYFYAAPWTAILISLRNALCCTLVALVIGLVIVILMKKYPRLSFIDTLFILPLGTSAVTLGLGYLLYYRKAVTSFWLIPIAHSLIALPFVVRTLQPAIRNIPGNLHDSASVLGAQPKAILTKIDLPIIRRSLINSAVFAFTISIGEFGATSFLSRPEEPTLSVAIYNYLSKPGGLNYGQAMAMATILMLFCFIAIFIMNRTEE